jgi:AcrR family transcriptional regulator
MARIIDASIDEFKSCSLENASIARIVEKAEIPRGSFYQYFEDIVDLYKFILQLTNSMKLKYMTDSMKRNDGRSTIEAIRGISAAVIRFTAEHPKLAAVENNFLREDRRLREKANTLLGSKPLEIYREILDRGKRKGEIAPGLDMEAASSLLLSMNNYIMDYMLGETEEEKAADGSARFTVFAENMLRVVEKGIIK